MLTFQNLTAPEDLQMIREIAADIWPKTFAEILSQEQINYMMKMMYSPAVMENELASGYHFTVSKTGGKAAGYFSWSAYTISGTAKLHKIYLLQEFHGKGIGSAMLAEAERQIRNAGFKTMRLNVNKYNARAKKAYLRNGFAIVESVKIDIGNGFYMDDFVMEKSL